MRLDTEEQARLLRRIRRIEGQVRGIRKMVEDDRYCVDVIIQVQAARAALATVGLTILDAHSRGCVADALQAGDTAIIDELMATIKKFIR